MDLPAIDQNICGQWTQLDNNMYNKLPFFFMEGQAATRKFWATWTKLLGSVAWKPNMGDTMRTVVAEPTPVIRQDAFPVLLNAVPLTDVIDYRERRLDSQPRWQDFVSPHFYWLPEFQDFLRHIQKTMDNLDRQMVIFENAFYRTQIYQRAPYVYVCGVGLIDAPTGDMNSAGNAAGSKTLAWLQSIIAQMDGAQPGWLTFEELFKALNEFEQSVGATPFEGTGLPSGDSAPLNERFALVQSPESWNNFVNDPWVKENRPINLNIITDEFKGDIFGRIRSKLERYPYRAAIDANFLPSFPNPETIQGNASREDYQRTIPNPAYARVANAPVEFAWLIGGNAADAIEVGPPPSEFTKELSQGDAIKMNWNGKPYMTKNFLVPCTSPAGVVTYDANSFGRYLRLQGTLNLGVRTVNPQNVLPIIFKRRVGITTATT